MCLVLKLNFKFIIFSYYLHIFIIISNLLYLVLVVGGEVLSQEVLGKVADGGRLVLPALLAFV